MNTPDTQRSSLSPALGPVQSSHIPRKSEKRWRHSFQWQLQPWIQYLREMGSDQNYCCHFRWPRGQQLGRKLHESNQKDLAHHKNRKEAQKTRNLQVRMPIPSQAQHVHRSPTSRSALWPKVPHKTILEKQEPAHDRQLRQHSEGAKTKQKYHKDAKSNVLSHNIQPGDHILLLECQTKSQWWYNPDPYTVTEV